MSRARKTGPSAPPDASLRNAQTGDDPNRARTAAPSNSANDSRKLLMPAGDEGPHHPAGERLATPSGGASGAEDSTRAAGYVADLSANRVPPPGPPVETDPAVFAGAETIPPPPPDPQGSEPAAPAGPRTDPAPVRSPEAKSPKASTPSKGNARRHGP